MRIVHVSTSDIKGGAARSAYRLHQGLVQSGHDSVMFVRHKSSDDARVIEMPLPPEAAQTMKLVQEYCIDENRTALSNTHFSIGYPDVDLSQRAEIQSADLIHLHWVSRFQSSQSIRALASLGKPIVWTFHDQRAFTGGCHFSAGCTRYQDECGDCPQLQEDFFQLSRAAVLDARDILPTGAITVVCPSRWMADCVRASAAFRNCEVRVVPYGVDTDVFFPRKKKAARKELELEKKPFVLLFGGDGLLARRKGFPALVEALQLAAQNRKFRERLELRRIVLLCFGGELGPLRKQLPARPIRLGRIDSDEKLAKIYSAADLFLLPSLEDNLPNVMIESLCCGTPGLAFDIGGVPEVIDRNVTGRLVRPGDSAGLAEAIVDLTLRPRRCAKMARKARRSARKRWSNQRQIDSYLSLYHDALHRSPRLDAREVEPADSRIAAIFPQLLALATERSRVAAPPA